MFAIKRKIDEYFGRLAKTIFRHPVVTLALCFLFIGALVIQIPKIRITTTPESFLKESEPTLVNYNKFRDQFGREEVIVLNVGPVDTVFNRAFLLKLKALQKDLQDNLPYVEEITSILNARNTRGENNKLIVEDLVKKIPADEREMRALVDRVNESNFYTNLYISEDRKYTAIMIKTQTYSPGNEADVLKGFDEGGQEGKGSKKTQTYLTDRENAKTVKALNAIAARYKAKDFPIQAAGIPVVSDEFAKGIRTDMAKFFLLAMLITFGFLYFMFRRISGIVIPFFVVILSILCTFGLMALTGVTIKTLSQVLPSFLLAIGIGSSVHLMAIFLMRLKENNHDKEEAIIYAMKHAGLTVFMTNIISTVGLWSFATSNVAPVAELGIFAGLGVMVIYFMTIIFLPALLAIFPIKNMSEKIKATDVTAMDRILAWCANVSIRYTKPIFIISAIVTVLAVIGLFKVRVSHDLVRWFPESDPIRVASESIDKNLRGTVTIEAIIDTGKENGLYDPFLMKKIDECITYIEQLKVNGIYVGKAWSLSTILKETNRALHENRKEFYAIPESKELIAQELLLFENSGSDDIKSFTDSTFRKARLTIKVPLMDAMAYGDFIEAINDHLRKNLPGNVTVSSTGMGVILATVIRSAIYSMGMSYVTSLLVITAMMIIFIGSFRMGLISMIPNIIPIIMALGLMGWLNIPMSLFVMFVGNIATGLAVDETVHVFHNYEKYCEESNDPEWAIRELMRTTGRAMFVSSAVLAAGFFIYMFAYLSNFRHFGFLTGFTIVMAVIADFFLTPALLLYMARRRNKGLASSRELNMANAQN